MNLFSGLYEPQRPLWTRDTRLYAGLGFVSYGLSIWLIPLTPSCLVAIICLTRLAVVGRRFGYALPYPFELIFLLYGWRDVWLPPDIAAELLGPAAFLMFTGACLMACLLFTSWALERAAPEVETTLLRRLTVLLFALSAAGTLIPDPLLAVRWFHYVAEPVAMVGYAALAGRTGRGIWFSRIP